MGRNEMSQTRRRAWLVAVVWSLAGIGFFVAFFSGGGAGEFDTDSGRHLVAALFIGLGFLGWWIGLWVTRSRDGEILADERDLHTIARAGQATLVVVCVAIFAITVGLWTFYEGSGAVPVGWMWFVAYTTVILATVTHALAILVLDGRVGGRG